MANDKPVLMRRAAGLRLADPSYYGLDQTDFEPGEDKFRKYLAADCSPLEVDVEVQGGQLKLEFKTEPVNQAQVSFVIVYPVGKSAPLNRRSRRSGAISPSGSIPSATRTFREMAEQMHLPGLHPEYLPEMAKTRIAS